MLILNGSIHTLQMHFAASFDVKMVRVAVLQHKKGLIKKGTCDSASCSVCVCWGGH